MYNYSPRANNLSNCDNGNARQVGRPCGTDSRDSTVRERHAPRTVGYGHAGAELAADRRAARRQAPGSAARPAAIADSCSGRRRARYGAAGQGRHRTEQLPRHIGQNTIVFLARRRFGPGLQANPEEPWPYRRQRRAELLRGRPMHLRLAFAPPLRRSSRAPFHPETP